MSYKVIKLHSETGQGPEEERNNVIHNDKVVEGTREGEFVVRRMMAGVAILIGFVLTPFCVVDVKKGHFLGLSSSSSSLSFSNVINTTEQQQKQCRSIMSSQNNISRRPSRHLNYTKDQHILFLHPGKSGGGTFQKRLGLFWKIGISQCHPHPCSITNNYFFNVQKQQQQQQYSIIVSIRDPIDRFVSAFYWRIRILCHPEGKKETRIHNNKKAAGHPEKYCKLSDDPKKQESIILLHKYQKNVSLLAEALCSSTNREEAIQDIQQIAHMEPLIAWLNTTTTTTSTADFDKNNKEKLTSFHDHLVPIILEKGFDFSIEIDDAVKLMQQTYNIENDKAFERRQGQVQEKYCEMELHPNEAYLASKHSSKVNSNKNNNILTKRGEQCLAQYFVQDYQLLQALLDYNVCKTKTCKPALQSILKRRNNVLSTLT